MDDLVAELLAFPGGKHDDQVDSISQALTWIRERRRAPTFSFA
jgi:phage terminase large subunit-like protein